MLFLTKNNEYMLENAIFAVVLNFSFVLYYIIQTNKFWYYGK